MVKKISRVRINITPQHSLPLSVRVRRNPRKITQAAINRFNTLVKTGVVSDLQFNKIGELTYANISPRITPSDLKSVRKVVVLSQEVGARAEKHLKSLGHAGKLIKIANARILDFERRGQFSWLHPVLEMDILQGKNPFATLTAAERSSEINSDLAREAASRFIARPEELVKNLKKQLIFFKSLMLKNNKKELVIFDELGKADSVMQVAKISDGKVVRETKIFIPSYNSLETFTVTLLPSGKVVHAIKEQKLRN